MASTVRPVPELAFVGQQPPSSQDGDAPLPSSADSGPSIVWPQHAHRLYWWRSGFRGRWQCDICSARGDGGVWHCSLCRYDVCTSCHPPPAQPPPSPDGQQPSHPSPSSLPPSSLSQPVQQLALSLLRGMQPPLLGLDWDGCMQRRLYCGLCAVMAALNVTSVACAGGGRVLCTMELLQAVMYALLVGILHTRQSGSRWPVYGALLLQAGSMRLGLQTACRHVLDCSGPAQHPLVMTTLTLDLSIPLAALLLCGWITLLGCSSLYPRQLLTASTWGWLRAASALPPSLSVSAFCCAVLSLVISRDALWLHGELTPRTAHSASLAGQLQLGSWCTVIGVLALAATQPRRVWLPAAQRLDLLLEKGKLEKAVHHVELCAAQLVLLQPALSLLIAACVNPDWPWQRVEPLLSVAVGAQLLNSAAWLATLAATTRRECGLLMSWAPGRTAMRLARPWLAARLLLREPIVSPSSATAAQTAMQALQGSAV